MKAHEACRIGQTPGASLVGVSQQKASQGVRRSPEVPPGFQAAGAPGGPSVESSLHGSGDPPTATFSGYFEDGGGGEAQEIGRGRRSPKQAAARRATTQTTTTMEATTMEVSDDETGLIHQPRRRSEEPLRA